MFKKGKVLITLALVLTLLISTCSAASYTVQKGDNLWDLAAKFLGSGREYTKIVDANPAIKDPNLIYVDQVLTIPEADPAEPPAPETTPAAAATGISADQAIVGISTIGYVDVDGAKVSAIAVEYNVDLTGAQVAPSLFEIADYGMTQGDDMCALGSDPGQPLKAYVNDKPAISAVGGTGTGKYVIIEVNADYQLMSVVGGAAHYKISMAAGIKQTGTIQANGCTILPGSQEFVNYEAVEVNNWGKVTVKNYAVDGKYFIEDIDKFELHTKETGTAYPATHCFEEETGEYMDIDLPYALYVPEDYDASKEYMMVLHIHDASAMGDDPVITLTESQGPINYASDAVQQIAKDQGYGGLIVVAPQFNNDIRTTRDNWSLSAGVPATWQLVDSITEQYNIDTDRIYASGQSMGGMQVMAMAAQRDNYFAAIWPIASQWGTNYNLEVEYQGKPYYEAPVDGTYILGVDAHGNPCDYRNMYYMLSDDNILVLNCADDMLSTNAWTEFYYLYKDLTGVEIKRSFFNPLTNSEEVQSDYIRALTAEDYEIGIYWGVNEGGSHGDSWVYAHRIDACYEWLLSQTREDEMNRSKLDLDKPFALADDQLQTSERLLLDVTDTNPEAIYFTTGKLGAGTADYNSANFGRGGQTLQSLPGWTADDPDSYGLGIYIFSFN